MGMLNFKLEAREYEKIVFVLSSLYQKLRVDSAFLINRNGQAIAYQGELRDLDLQALSSLAASNLAATFGLALLLGEREFERIHHKGEKSSILINPVGKHALLVLILPGNGEVGLDSLGLRQATLVLEDILSKCEERLQAAQKG